MNVYFVRYILGRKTHLSWERHWSSAPSSISQARRGCCLVFPEIRSQGCSPAPVFKPLPVIAQYPCFRKDTTWYRKMVIHWQRAKKKRDSNTLQGTSAVFVSPARPHSSAVNTHPTFISDFHGTRAGAWWQTELYFCFPCPAVYCQFCAGKKVTIPCVIFRWPYSLLLLKEE